MFHLVDYIRHLLVVHKGHLLVGRKDHRLVAHKVLQGLEDSLAEVERRDIPVEERWDSQPLDKVVVEEDIHLVDLRNILDWDLSKNCVNKRTYDDI